MYRSLLVLALLIPGASAAFLEDPVGDHFAVPVMGTNDLVSLEMQRVPGGIELQLGVAAIDQTVGVEPIEGVLHLIYFGYGTESYRVWVYWHPYLLQARDGGPSTGAGLDLQRADAGWRQITDNLESNHDVDSGIFSVLIPDELVKNEYRVPLRPDAQLHSWWVESTNTARSLGNFIVGDVPSIYDRMPDEGISPTAYIVPGGDGSGASMLTSRHAVRSSNGGPNTIVYPFDLYSEDGGHYDMELVSVPEHWQAIVVPSAIVAEPGSTVSGWVVVNVEGAHQHGAEDRIMLQTSGGSASLELTLIYPETPIPAGHHNTVYFHSRMAPTDGFGLQAATDPVFANERLLWMNTLQADELSDPEPVEASFEQRGWRIPLAPKMGTGLVILDGEARVTARMDASRDLDITGETFRAELWIEGEDTPLATSADLVTDVPADGMDVEFVLPMQARTIAAAPDLNLVLQIHRERSGTPPGDYEGFVQPRLLPGASMQLPLGEYRDALPPDVMDALREQGVLDETGAIHEAPALEAHESPTGLGFGLGAIFAAWGVHAGRGRREP